MHPHSNIVPIESELMIAVAPWLHFEISLMVLISGPEMRCGQKLGAHQVALELRDLTETQLVL